jgi:MFS transporter, CP family, cyanate transporter
MFAATAPRLARRFGAERVILVLLMVLGVGTALRGLGTLPALLAGSVLAGAAIAVVNVLLPGLVKRDFPNRVATVTAFYTMALCAGAAAAAGLTVPFERATGCGWQGALAAWAAPAFATALLWGPQAVRRTDPAHPVAVRGPSLLRQPLAWQVTGFMGLQSALAYCIFGWLAPLLRARGLDAATAGYVVSVSVLAQTAACLLAPGLATRTRHQSGFCVAIVVMAVGGFLGALFAPLPTVWAWAVLQGLGQGSLIATALLLIVLRSPDPVSAAALSGMAQGFGYTVAAFGPLAMGVLFSGTGRPGATAPLVLALGLGAAVSGWFAGRDRSVPGR